MTGIEDGHPSQGEPHPIERTDSKLRLLASPLAHTETLPRVQSMGAASEYEQRDLESLGYRHQGDHICPDFVKHSSSTTYELFYDLWWVANIEVFSTVHDITDTASLSGYTGYVTLLWFTWFSVGMFDVRFVTDSIFERLTRTAHLGVMVGFSVIATNFEPDKQVQSVFQTVSILLTVSRLILVCQYCTIIWHIRHYREGKIPLAITAFFHFAAAMIYLGITFRFQNGTNSRVFIAWYIIGASEALLNLGFSLFSKVLSFNGTHLTERMTLATVIILGEGVISIAKTVAVIVKNNGWTSATIGILVAAIANLYLFFMIYFDWQNFHHLKDWRQVTWTFLHFPFHICLLFFAEGATQFLTWWKLGEVTVWSSTEIAQALFRYDNATSAVVQSLNETVASIFEQYPSTYTLTDVHVEEILGNISTVPDGLWPNLTNHTFQDTDPVAIEVINWASGLIITVLNSIFINFKIDGFEDLKNQNSTTDFSALQDTALEETATRFGLVFQYVYATAGIAVIIMTVCHILTKRHGWTAASIARVTVFMLLGLGMCLLVLISLNDDSASNFMASPMLLPTITIVLFVILILTHLPKPPPLFFKNRTRKMAWGRKQQEKDGRSAYTTVEQVHSGQGFDFDQQVYQGQRNDQVYEQYSHQYGHQYGHQQDPQHGNLYAAGDQLSSPQPIGYVGSCASVPLHNAQ